MGNPRCSNGSLRRRNRRRLRFEGRPCWICQVFGRDARIDYSLPATHPLSFEVDEIVPVSRYWLGGYGSPEQCAADYSNQWRSNRTVAEVVAEAARARSAESAKKDGLPQPWGL